MREIILITVAGTDKPGLTEALTEILAHYGAHILDIGQAVIHETLSLGILIEVPEQAESSPVLRDVLFKAHAMGLNLSFKPIGENDYEHWVSEQGKQRFIVTLLGRIITAKHISKVTQIVVQQGLNIDKISRLSGRISLDPSQSDTKACIDLSVRGTPHNSETMRVNFMALSHDLKLDIAVQEDDIYRRNRRLVVFDMDSTLIQCEVIDELAKEAGVGAQVMEITEKAMRGDIDFSESFQRRLSLLKGLPETTLHSIAQELPLTEGADYLLSTLRRLGFKTAIISGGFGYFARHLQQRLGIDHVIANELEIKNGTLTGKHLGRIVDANVKGEAVEELARKENIGLRQVVAVGDGANDLEMLKRAGLGIAFQAKPLVRQSAKQSLSTLGLDGILYLMGIRDRELRAQ